MNSHKDTSPFIYLIGNVPTMKIMDFLICNSPYNYNKTQIAESIGISRKTLYNAWVILEHFNIVKTISSDKRTRFYVLNKDSQITKYLIKLHAATMHNTQGGFDGFTD